MHGVSFIDIEVVSSVPLPWNVSNEKFYSFGFRSFYLYYYLYYYNVNKLNNNTEFNVTFMISLIYLVINFINDTY